MKRIENTVKPGEKAEPLGDGYYIIQREDGYRFGSDAVALAHFALRYIDRRDRVLDLCSGCGIIGIMINIAAEAEVDGLEIDKELFDMSVRSTELNGLKNIAFTWGDARDLPSRMRGAYDVVTCNPPYYKANSKPTVTAPAANSEINITLSEAVSAAAQALKSGGALFMTHVTSRLDEVICACRDNKLAVKKLVVNPNGKTFMLRAVRGGKPFMEFEIKEY